MKLTDKELTAIEHLNHEAHRTIEATAKLAERARGPVTEDAAEEARLSKALSEHRRAIFKGVHAIQERLGLDWVDLRTRWPSKADELADALTKALKAEAALGTCPDHQLDARLGDQSTAVAKLNALVFRARRLLAAGGDETLPAWIEGSNVREGNLDTAIAEAAAAVDKAHSLEAEAKAARKAAEDALHAFQSSASALVKRLRVHGQPASARLSAFSIDNQRINNLIGGHTSVQATTESLESLASHYRKLFANLTNKDAA